MGEWGVNPMESAHFLSIGAFTFVVALIVAEFAGLFVFFSLNVLACPTNIFVVFLPRQDRPAGSVK